MTGIAKSKRLHFLDNLRTLIIFFVVVVHTSGLYLMGDTWSWFWIVEDPSNNSVSGLIFLVLDIFLMATLFFISGYLAPPSLKKKSPGEFFWSKFRRLIIPWLIAVLTLIPLYKVIFLYSRGLPQENWTTYFHITNPNSQNWLWFLPVLFLFNIIYVVMSESKSKLPKISFRWAVLTTFVVGYLYSVGMSLYGLSGWTLTPLLDFQNERILIYFMFFLLGILGYRLRIFDEKPQSRALFIAVNLTSWVPITAYIFFLLYPLVFSPGNFVVSRVADTWITWFCFQLALFGLVYQMIQTSWRFFDGTGRIWSELNRNSYGVYIIHVVVLGVIALFLRETAMPSLWKHFTLALSTYIVCNLLISIYRLVVTSSRELPQPEIAASR
ncbi:MAG: acyltransferase family protein [Ardenticatenaceae bacterium]|nr:acyltransferase family protein [Ardenticatenaceae bacterium]